MILNVERSTKHSTLCWETRKPDTIVANWFLSAAFLLYDHYHFNPVEVKTSRRPKSNTIHLSSFATRVLNWNTYAHSNRLTLKFKAEQASCSNPRGHHRKKRLHKKFQQKLLPSTLRSLKFASCEKHMKSFLKKKTKKWGVWYLRLPQGSPANFN
jgi:hypothetical protein